MNCANFRTLELIEVFNLDVYDDITESATFIYRDEKNCCNNFMNIKAYLQVIQSYTGKKI